MISSVDASAWIDLLLARSDELRRAGILAIGVDGCTATIGPAPSPPVVGDRQEPERDYAGDPLNDPASYADGVVPGFEITPYPRLEE